MSSTTAATLNPVEVHSLVRALIIAQGVRDWCMHR